MRQSPVGHKKLCLAVIKNLQTPLHHLFSTLLYPDTHFTPTSKPFNLSFLAVFSTAVRQRLILTLDEGYSALPSGLRRGESHIEKLTIYFWAIKEVYLEKNIGIDIPSAST